MPIKHTSSLSQVIQQLETHKISVDEALSWMAYKGRNVRLSYSKEMQLWECYWIVGEGSDDNNIAFVRNHEGMRDSVLGAVKMAKESGIDL